MKILRIIYDWPKPWNGLAPHPYEITKSQLALGHEIEMFVGLWPKAGGPEQLPGLKLNTLWREPFPGTVSLTTSVALLFKYILWRRKNTPDIIHSHGHFAIWIYLYRLLLKKFFPWAKELQVPLVVHFHRIAKDRWAKMEEEGKTIAPHSKAIQWPLEVFSDGLAVKAGAALVFVSEDNKQAAIKFHKADPQKCFVVESGVNPDLFAPAGAEEKEKSRKELGLDMYDKVILYNGNMIERKNVHVLVEAMRYLPAHYKLLLVGPGDPAYMQRLNEAIAHNKVEDQVIQTGYTPYPEVPIAFQIADVFVLPSSWEGLPKVIVQALAVGIPSLASGFKLSEEVDGLFYLDNIEAEYIAQRIKEIIENPPHVDRQKVMVGYSWAHKVQEIEKVYEFAKQNYL